MLWRQGKAYSRDLRERVFAAANDGERVGQIAVLLRVSMSYVSKVLSCRRLTGPTTALAHRCRVPPKLTDLHAAIRTEVAARPDATIAELRAWLAATHQVSASNGLIWATLRTLDLRLKKSLRAAEQDRPDVAKARSVRTGAKNNPA
jgi:transposase